MVSLSFGANNGTSFAKYEPTIGTDTIIENGQSRSVNTKMHCITAMKEYEGKSLEELRIEDYLAKRKGPQTVATVGFGFGAFTQPVGGGTGVFGATSQPSIFGQTAEETTENKNIFGSNLNAFEQTAEGTTENKNIFGSNLNAFGQTAATGFQFPTTQPIRFTRTAGFGGTDTCTSFGTKPTFGTTVEQTTKNFPLNGTGLFGAISRPSASDTGNTNDKDLFNTTSTFGQPATIGFGIATTQSFGPTDVSNSVGNKPSLNFEQIMDTSAASAFGPTTCLDVSSGTAVGQQQRNISTANTDCGGFVTNVGGISGPMRAKSFGPIPSYIVYLFVFLVLLSFLSFVLHLLPILF